MPSTGIAERYPLILAGIYRGDSVAKIGRDLRDAGLGIRTQTLYRWASAARREVNVRADVLGLPSHGVPEAHQVGVWPTTTGRTGYVHIVQLATQSRVTGEVGLRTVSVSSQTLLTRAEAEAQAADAIAEQEDNYPDRRVIGYAQVAVRQLTNSPV